MTPTPEKETPEAMADYAVTAFIDGLISSRKMREDVCAALHSAREHWREEVIAMATRQFEVENKMVQEATLSPLDQIRKAMLSGARTGAMSMLRAIRSLAQGGGN